MIAFCLQEIIVRKLHSVKALPQSRRGPEHFAQAIIAALVQPPHLRRVTHARLRAPDDYD